MASLVESMLSLHKELQVARAEQEKGFIQKQIEEPARKMDALVYELYNLTEEEIRIVEESVK
jgi:adenine-specific DNA-methyltransferase